MAAAGGAAPGPARLQRVPSAEPLSSKPDSALSQ